MKRVFFLSISALALAACSQTQASWSRIDGRSGSALDLEQARRICEPRARAGALSPQLSQGIAPDTGSAIAAGINNGLMARALKSDIMESCMAEHGFKQSR